MCKEMYDKWRGIDGFATVRYPLKAVLLGTIHLTNETGQILEILLSPMNNQRILSKRRIDANFNASGVGGGLEVSYEPATNAEKVQWSVLGNGETAILETYSNKAYLTIIAKKPSGGKFNVVDDVMVHRRREYVFKLKHLISSNPSS
jgi:hypothetical protein